MNRVAVEWNVAIGVIDAQPETEKVADFCFDHPGWFRAYYPSSHQVKKVDARVDYVEAIVQVDRTASLDRSYRDYQLQNVLLPKDFQRWRNGKFVEEMEAAVRIYEEGKQGCPGRYVWTEGSKPDHDRQADNYARIAATLYDGGGSAIEVISQ